ncbi:cupin domain-containing protein [Roseisolibacter sp. H3M3-2]|uniref:cupin domain-containing protein n=1 Tax=Roseisolibacter sp. H3M3-2 TaxID=3031323 RepID=UPI0023DA7A2F|nr:cupin domain-containing protein [Roseisolibacter sp. H3M3-2]MDF1502538.1 cupin domain-containing protein [Roseisolibacter sp. H3M3-2]
MTSAASPLVAAPDAGTAADIRRFRTRVRVRAEASGGAASVLEHTLDAGCVAMPVHRHAGVCEVLHVLEGTLWLWLDGEERRLPAGSSAVVPPGARHTFWVDVDAPRPARVLVVASPGGMERYYEDVAAHVPDAATGRGPDMAGVLAAGARHGVEAELPSLYELIARHGLSLA